MRIIGGRWRGTKLNPPAVDELQPSKGFVREVLFNWLADRLDGCAVLDCFAGSGALAFESVSRGARHAELWEIHPRLVRALNDTCARLAPTQLCVRSHNAYLPAVPAGDVCDIVFIDPPFTHETSKVMQLLNRLHKRGRLDKGSLVYLERPSPAQDLDASLELVRERRCAGVFISLWQWQLPAPQDNATATTPPCPPAIAGTPGTATDDVG